MSVELIERIKKVNTSSERINKQSVEAQAKRKLLSEQISEKVAEFEQEYGISFPNLENIEEFESFLDQLISSEEQSLEEQVFLADKVNKLISEGNIEEAQELLNYKEDSISNLKDEKVKEVPQTLEQAGVSQLDDVNDSEEDVISDESLKKDKSTEDLIKKRSSRRVTSNKVATSDFDMGVTLDDLDSVAEEEPSVEESEVDLDDLDIVEEEVVAPIRPRRRRRTPIVEDDVVEEVVPKRTSPIKTGGSFTWGD